MCTNMFAWLLKILCQTFIAFDQNRIIYDKKKNQMQDECMEVHAWPKLNAANA